MSKFITGLLILTVLFIFSRPVQGLDDIKLGIGLASLAGEHVSFTPVKNTRIYALKTKQLEKLNRIPGSFYQVQAEIYNQWTDACRGLRSWKRVINQASEKKVFLDPPRVYLVSISRQYYICIGKVNRLEQAQQIKTAIEKFWPNVTYRIVHLVEELEPTGNSLFAGENCQGRFYTDRGVLSLITKTGKQIVSRESLYFAPVEARNNTRTFQFEKKSYPGALELRYDPESGIITPVSQLNIEVYLPGVLAGEIYDNWPIETIKAQTVAARSYAYAYRGKHVADGFDICDSSHCQSYQGWQSASRFHEAVETTAGEVMTYENLVIGALYHASAGGRTENIEDIWPNSLPRPYYRSVPDFDQGTRGYEWDAPVILKAEDAIQKLGWQGGDTVDMEIIPADAGCYPLIRFTNTTANQIKEFTHQSLRWVFNLPSPKFVITYWPDEEGLQRYLQMECTRPLRDILSVFLPPYLKIEDSAFTGGTAKPAKVRLSPRACLYIYGYGKGHGVGLSQWGSYVLGTQGMEYRQILMYYYGQAIEIKENYGM